jgi:hypothetical protein
MREGKGFLRELRQSILRIAEEGMHYISGVLYGHLEQENRTIRAIDIYTHSGILGSDRHTGISLQRIDNGGKEAH